MSKIRVLIVINDLLPGGAQKIATDIASRVDHVQFDITVSFFTSHPESETLADTLRDMGVTLISLEGRGVLQKMAALIKTIRHERIQVIQTFLPYAGIIGRLAGVLTGTPVISAQCNLPHTYPLRVRVLDALTLPLVKAWVGNTSGIEMKYGGTSSIFSEEAWQKGRRHFTLYAGVDVAAIQARVQNVTTEMLRKSLSIPPGMPLLMMTARLISWKGHRTLLEALPLLPRTHLLLVGWGPLESELKECATRLGIEDRVHFLGRRKDAIELLAITDCYVQTHETGKEGIWIGPNLSQIEACAAAVPSVSSAVPHIEELLKDGVTGRLARVDDPNDLARVIQEVLGNRDTSDLLAHAAQKIVKERFSVQAMVHVYESLYHHTVRDL